MKKITISLLVLSLVFTLSSFTNTPQYNFIGTYGVGDNDPSQIELTLNEDHSFSYQDFSNPSKKIDVTGEWKQKNNHILLTNYNSDLSFHTKWKISDDGKAAKSRNALCFYRLIKK